LHDFDPCLARSSREHRVELVAPNHGGEHVATARQIDAADWSCRFAASHFDCGFVES